MGLTPEDLRDELSPRGIPFTMTAARIIEIFVGMPKQYSYESASGKQVPFESGIFKAPVTGPVWVGQTNVAGDGQSDLRHHGGPDRAVMMFAASLYPRYEELLEMKIPGGGFGENFTMEGISDTDVCLGDVWQTDSVTLEVSQARLPCFKLGRRLDCAAAVEAVVDQRAGGWYCRTLRQGLVQAGEVLRLVERPFPEWTISRAFEVFMEASDLDTMRSLNAVPALSQLWRDRLGPRLD